MPRVENEQDVIRKECKPKNDNFIFFKLYIMNKIKNLNKTKRGKQKEKIKIKTRKLFKGGGECKGPMCTICQECLTVRDDPKYSKYFDMLESEIKVVVQQRMVEANLDPLILDYPDAPIDDERPLYQHTCDGFFHLECIKSWCLRKKNADVCPCPNCKQPVDFKSLDLDAYEARDLCEFRKSNIIDAFIVLRDRHNNLVDEWEKLVQYNDELQRHNKELRSFYRNLKIENDKLKNKCKELQGV